MKVYILFSGGHAKQCIDIFLENGVQILGLFDQSYLKNNQNHIHFYRGTKVIGDIDHLSNFCNGDEEDVYIFCAAGDNTTRKEIVQKYPLSKYKYVNCISKTAYISEGSKIGIGNYIGIFSEVSSNVKIGDFNILNDKCQVMHDNIIGDFNHISCNTTLCGYVKIISHCFIGACAVVNNKITIGKDIIVGSNSTVIKDVNESGTYAGTPIRRIK